VTDFVEAVGRCVHTFKAAGFAAPDCILLKDHEQGIRMLSELRNMEMMTYRAGDPRMGKVIEHPDGTCWMQAEVYGVKIRWPAVKMALPEGGYVWT
jgi:aminoglycoside/choline kinase family phosphotransferase